MQYNYDSEYYETGIGGFHESSFRPIAREFDQNVGACDDSKILDFGCGSGFYGEFLRSKSSHVDGIDNSGVVEKNQHRAFYRHLMRADLGKSYNVPEPYDIVFSIEVIEHVENYHQFLSNAYDALKPGGRIFITTTTYFWSIFILLIIYRRQTSLGALAQFVHGLWDEKARTEFVKRFWEFFTGHYHGFTKRQLKHGLEQAGFCVERLEYLHVQDTFPTRYLDQPYNGRLRWMVRVAVPVIKASGKFINWSCRRFDLYAPNVVAVAQKPIN